jgi:cytosine permease
MSLVNAVPRLGRLPATIAAGTLAVALSGFPAFIEEAQSWITHLGNVAAPLAGVVLADYVLVQRMNIDVPALFDARGRYRYAWGVNLAAVAATAIGVAVFYAVPHEFLKVFWGVSAAALVYLALNSLQARLLDRELGGQWAAQQAVQRVGRR